MLTRILHEKEGLEGIDNPGHSPKCKGKPVLHVKCVTGLWKKSNTLRFICWVGYKAAYFMLQEWRKN